MLARCDLLSHILEFLILLRAGGQLAGVQADSNLYGAFPVKEFVFGFAGSLFGAKSRSSSRRLRSGSRSARKRSRDRNI
jgi:hypothetical protein